MTGSILLLNPSPDIDNFIRFIFTFGATGAAIGILFLIKYGRNKTLEDFCNVGVFFGYISMILSGLGYLFFDVVKVLIKG